VDALRIPYGGVLTLFECFLASVATCVHTSPSSPAGVLGAEAAREIRQIAVYAADHMMDRHRRQRQEHTMAAEGGENVDPSAGEGHGAASFTFGTFGEWYNSGGFELVPWLELLDRSKWETTGDASGHATTEDKAKGAHPRDDQKPPQNLQRVRHALPPPQLRHQQQPAASPFSAPATRAAS